MAFYSKNIPKELKALKQWVCYRTKKQEEKTAKFMISAVTGEFAKSNDASTWTDYDSAFRYMVAKRMEGLAFVLTEGLVFVDIDHVTDEEGNVGEFALKLLEELPDTYAERSVSGKGVHIFCYGKFPENALKRNDDLGLEMYDTKRFVCITGDLIDGRNTILDYSDAIQEINEKYVGKRPVRENPITYGTASLTDSELISKIQASRQGMKFAALYSGNISGYPSHSNADYAFVRMLSFWTQDANQIDAIVRSSGLYRDKWDRRIGGSTYGEITIENALREQGAAYKKSVPEM